uniref:Angiopoietin-1 receptor-like isoform X4 n=1 Tax=Crassostrea virginica TaxID=6565 RepID=A0A8B8E6C4_CRAVI|nr:angiopoietin-1 receptor-like isoform X4 [Crassostrea virginica]
MINISDIFISLLVLFQTSRVCYAKCSGYENLECCPDTFWNPDKNSCDRCPAGYLGVNCSARCSPPSYGKDCQLWCSCRPSEICHWLQGCVATQTEGTTASQTTLVTTARNTQTMAESTRPTPSTRTTSELNLTIAVTHSKSYTSPKLYKYPDTGTWQNNVNFLNSPMQLGILLLCVVFLVLFAVFVGTQIRQKCVNNDLSRSHNIYGYNPHIKSYDVINPEHSPDVGNVSQGEEATSPDRTSPKYLEVVGSPKNSFSGDHGNPLPACGSNAYMSECTQPKQLYLSAV